ncbi:MAG: hypothetical protein NTV51_20195 [Verrucomicrobia bacterium]|nr:hypothetical protein [Verrucomicrobiota bacterium]
MKPADQQPDGGPRPPSKGAAPGRVSDSRIPDDPADEAPGVPGFRTWKGIYVFVFVTFVAVVAALALFSRVFA